MKFCKRFLTALIIFALSGIAAISIAGCAGSEAASVTFMVDNSVYGIVKVRDGSEAAPDDPEKDLYQFAGWFEDKELKTEFDFSAYSADKNREDKVVYAGFKFNGETFTVTLNGNGGKLGADTAATLDVRERETIGSVADPVREDYKFVGWSESKNGYSIWNVNTDTVTANTVLYALWVKKFNVTFDANGGSISGEAEKKVTALQGEYLSEPDDLDYRSLDELAGWSRYPNATEADWDFDEDTVYENMTLYAVWQPKVQEFNVEFVLNYSGAKDETKSTVKGLIAYEPEREGYVFNGWWYSIGEKDADGNYILTTKVDLTKQITTKGTKVYASWIDEDDICSILPTPNPTYSNGTVIWTKIEGAAGYDIKIWSSTQEEKNAYTNSLTTTSYNVYENNGTYYFKIRSRGDGYTTVNSEWKSYSFYHKQLASPVISFDLTTSVLSWNTVKNAAEYKLYINDTEKAILNTAREYDLSDYDAGVYQVRVEVSAGGYASGSATASVFKARLKAPQVTALYNENNKTYQLRWNAVVNADKYIVTINGKENTPQTGTSYSISSSAWGENKELTYKVDAFDSKADYLISDAKEAKLGTPNTTTVKLEGATGSVKASNVMGKFCTVTLDPNGGKIRIGLTEFAANARYSMSVSANAGIAYPTNPARDGYVFTGWYTDNACTKLFDFSQTLYADITLYAGWYEMPTGAAVNSNKAVSTYSSDHPNGGVGLGSGNISTSGTSSSKRNYEYFCALTGGEYEITYEVNTAGQAYGTYFCIYNVTKKEVILSRTLVIATNTTAGSSATGNDTYDGTVTFTASAGDIIYVENYRANEDYYTTYRFWIWGGKAPASGGKFVSNHYAVNKNISVSDNNTFTAGVGTEVVLTATDVDGKTFKGWYDTDGNLLSEEIILKYTVTDAENVVLTAKWE